MGSRPSARASTSVADDRWGARPLQFAVPTRPPGSGSAGRSVRVHIVYGAGEVRLPGRRGQPQPVQFARAQPRRSGSRLRSDRARIPSTYPVCAAFIRVERTTLTPVFGRGHQVFMSPSIHVLWSRRIQTPRPSGRSRRDTRDLGAPLRRVSLVGVSHGGRSATCQRRGRSSISAAWSGVARGRPALRHSSTASDTRSTLVGMRSPR